MRTVNAAKFKDQPSTYLTYAAAGEVIVIREGKQPIAKLIPFLEETFSAEELEMAAAGVIRLPTVPFDIDELWKLPMPRVKGNAGTQAILDEREEGR